MKYLVKLLFFFILFLINIEVQAGQVAVFDSNSGFNNPAMNIKFQDVKKIPKSNLANISVQNYPILIFTDYKNIDESAISSIQKYINCGGKIILATPQSALEDKTFVRLSKFVGVNVEKIVPLTSATEVNWVEKTVTQNVLPAGSRTAKVSLNIVTNHLAVFGNIERHESAISKNKNGVVISWCWGKDGTKTLNDKSMQYIIEMLLPKSNSSNQSYSTMFSSHEDLKNLQTVRDYIENYQDNPINYINDISEAQQNIKKSKINELWASYYAKNSDRKSYDKYLNLSKSNAYGALKGTVDVAGAENRGIWFDRGTIVKIKSKSEMARYFDKLKNSGINTVYFETVNAGYAIYPSTVTAQNPLTLGRDPLSWAIDEAHLRKIKIHAWVWVFAVGNDRHNKIIDKSNDYPGPVLEKNLKWALLGENGNLRPKNQPEFWLDPSNTEATNYVIRLCDEIVRNYNVDGIQLDYIRYPFQSSDNMMGFNHNSLEKYTIQTGEKLFSNSSATNNMWNKWKEDNINNFVKKVSGNIRRNRFGTKISASVFSKSHDSRLNSIQQNWENWLSNSYVDSLTPMTYSVSTDALSGNISPFKNVADIGLVYPAVALQHANEIELMKQVSKIREEGFPGVSLFAVAQLSDEKANFLRSGFFSQNISDVSYNPKQSAIIVLETYKKMLEAIANTTYDLPQYQKTELNELISMASSAITKANIGQTRAAAETVKSMENYNSEFFKRYSCINQTRKQIAGGYLKRAENLLKLAGK